MISVYVNDDLIPNKNKGLDLEKLHFRFSSHYWPDSFIEKGTEVCTIYLPGRNRHYLCSYFGFHMQRTGLY